MDDNLKRKISRNKYLRFYLKPFITRTAGAVTLGVTLLSPRLETQGASSPDLFSPGDRVGQCDTKYPHANPACGAPADFVQINGEASSTQNRVPRKNSVTTCGNEMQVKLARNEANQGGLLLVEARIPKTWSDVKADWDERQISFWLSSGTADKRFALWRGLAGVDLEKAPGAYELNLSAANENGQRMSCAVSMKIIAGKFATESLQVGKEFVEPNPEQLARVQEEQQKLHAIYEQVTPERLWSGPFRVPLDGVKTGGNFGRRRILNGEPRSPHTGVDFPSPSGTPVHAAQSGRVVLAEPLFYAGNAVIVDHGLGVYTLYAHLSEFSVKVGDSVKAGDVLGKVGATGRVTGPHLHWGLTVNRERVNALQIVSLAGMN